MKEFIEKWLKEGLISSVQAEKMLADIEKDSSEKSSKKIILTFSLIGAALAGAGFILFISANWQIIPGIIKILLMSLITFGCTFGGYYLEFENKKYPKTGASLLFLGAILFGALIFLTAQVYHTGTQTDVHFLVLIWLFGIIAYAYILQSRSVAVLSCVLFAIWISMFFMRYGIYFDRYLSSIPLIYYAAALFVYSFGRVNKFFVYGTKLSAVFEKFGIFILYFCAFFITFDYFAAPHENIPFSFYAGFTDIMLISSIAMFVPSFFFNPSKSKANCAESVLIAALICMCVVLCGKNFIPPALLRITTNLFFASILLTLIYAGYKKRESFYVNIGIFWLIVFIAVKYFDFFWKLLPRSLFFLAGGILLVGAALFLEHKRRGINTEFKDDSEASE
ncbi:MAG: DUF2157 domain-containing protein [Endomicrobium sp.]|jgi:uncharacterized membrane protein|nr:DUF2157 domain-containing protein [Endomicrobium sp.]